MSQLTKVEPSLHGTKLHLKLFKGAFCKTNPREDKIVSIGGSSTSCILTRFHLL